MQTLLIGGISFYQRVLSRDQGVIPRLFGYAKPTCIFYPTCSEYAKESLRKYGAWKGTLRALARIGRCNPFHEPGVDLP